MKNVAVATAVFTSALFSGIAQADTTYTCTHDADERIISVVYQDQESQLPCQVDYTKGGVTETIWTSDYTAGFCAEKAEALVEKQASWGWSCTSDAAMATTDVVVKENVAEENAAPENMAAEPEAKSDMIETEEVTKAADTAAPEAMDAPKEAAEEPKRASETPYLQ